MSAGYEDEQKKLRATVAELTDFIETAEQKSADVTAFISVVQKYERITELTPEIMHELIEKIVVHAPDKSSGHRTQQMDIYYRFDVAVSTAVADSMKYDKRERLRNRHGYATSSSNHKNFFTSTRFRGAVIFLHKPSFVRITCTKDKTRRADICSEDCRIFCAVW